MIRAPGTKERDLEVRRYVNIYGVMPEPAVVVRVVLLL